MLINMISYLENPLAYVNRHRYNEIKRKINQKNLINFRNEIDLLLK